MVERIGVAASTFPGGCAGGVWEFEFFRNGSLVQEFSAKLSDQGVVYNEELTLRRKDGSLLVISEIAVAIRDKNGSVIFFDGLVEDITERKKSQKQFAVQKTYLEKLFKICNF